MCKFKVGQKVYLREDSQFATGVTYGANPNNVIGVIISIDEDFLDDGDLGIRVHWNNGEENNYDERDLKPVVLPNHKIQREKSKL